MFSGQCQYKRERVLTGLRKSSKIVDYSAEIRFAVKYYMRRGSAEKGRVCFWVSEG